MEWVETTGATVADALDAALDQLGVDDDDVEYQVLQEPKSGLFGRLGGNPARIRARVKPVSREKPGDRQRGRGRPPRRNGGTKRGSGAKGGGDSAAVSGDADDAAVGTATSGNGGSGEPGSGTRSSRSRSRRRGGRGRSGGSGGGTSGTASPGRTASDGGGEPRKGNSQVETEEIPIGEQADAADEFVRGLLDAASISAQVSVRIEEDAVLVDVEGDDLGVLVGPKGVTLRAIEDLVRTIVQRRTDGHGARIHVDVGGYQAKRRAALEQFTQGLTDRVLS